MAKVKDVLREKICFSWNILLVFSNFSYLLENGYSNSFQTRYTKNICLVFQIFYDWYCYGLKPWLCLIIVKRCIRYRGLAFEENIRNLLFN